MTLEAKTYGRGRPLVLLHGLLGSRDNWHGIARQLEEEFRVIVPDLRNHGRSPHSAEMGYSDMASDVMELMDREGVKAAGVVGHSMGGKVAMEIALSAPSRVDRLLVEDMVPGRTSMESISYVRALIDLDVESLSSRKEAEQRLSESVESRTMVLFLLKNLRRNRDGSYQWIANLDAVAAAYDELRGGLERDRVYRGPVLFVRGASSNTVSKDRIEEIERFFPQAKLETVREAGHWVHADAPERFLHLLRRHMSGSEGCEDASA